MSATIDTIGGYTPLHQNTAANEDRSEKKIFHENDPKIQLLLQQIEDHNAEFGTDLSIEDFAQRRVQNGETYYVFNDGLLPTFKNVINKAIKKTEKEMASLLQKIDTKADLGKRAKNIMERLKTAQKKAKGNNITIDAKLKQDLQKLLDDFNEHHGSNYRLEDFGTTKNIGGKTVFVFDKNKLSGDKSLLQRLEKDTQAVLSEDKKLTLELQKKNKQLAIYHTMYTSMVKAVGDMIKDNNRSAAI